MSSLNYLAHWGCGYGAVWRCSLPERAPALDFAGDLQRAPFPPPLAVTFPRGAAETLASRPCLSSTGAPASLRKKRMYRCASASSKGICSARLTESSFGPAVHPFNPVLSFSEFDRRNKQVNREKPEVGGSRGVFGGWGGGQQRRA